MWIAGASAGFGEQLARAYAAAGFDLLLIARRAELLSTTAANIETESGVQVETLALDLNTNTLVAQLSPYLETHPPAIGIYNAAFAPISPFLDLSSDDVQATVWVNAQNPAIWCWLLGRAMRAQGGGHLVLMSSLAGNQGSPNISTYAATKAFNTILAEGLWYELKQWQISTWVCTAGAISTPNFAAANQAKQGAKTPGELEPQNLALQIVEKTRRPSASPRYCPGWINTLADKLLGRWLPRKLAIRLMALNTNNLTHS